MRSYLKMKLVSSAFLAFFIFITFLSSNGYSQYYGYFGGCLTGIGCTGAYKAATIIGLSVDTLNYGISEYRYHKAQEYQIQQMQYEADAARAAVNYQKQMEDYKNMMLVAPFFEDSIPRTSQSSPKVPSLTTKKSAETK